MLYIVSTPIGNLGDITARALEMLREADIIACEDTRHSQKLLNHFDIHKPLMSCFEHNERDSSDRIIAALAEGKTVAYVTDAGTPVISDPGNTLIQKVREAGFEYTTAPGPCAAINALVLSGLDASRFTFLGFLPKVSSERKRFFEGTDRLKGTLIFYVSPHAVEKDLTLLHGVYGPRKAVLVREMTKIHESVTHFTLGEMPDDMLKGEMVLLVEGAEDVQENALCELTPEEHLRAYLQSGMEKGEAIKRVAKERGVHKSEIYKLTI